MFYNSKYDVRQILLLVLSGTRTTQNHIAKNDKTSANLLAGLGEGTEEKKSTFETRFGKKIVFLKKIHIK